jgi:ATP-dependent DNA ligase
MTEQFATLYHKGSKGTIYSWKIWTEGADIVTEYGQIDGKKQTARKTSTPKNVGRANETTPEEQALSEAQSMWTFKVERKYRESIDDAQEQEVFLPMLAAGFEKRRGKKKDGHTYPCDVQPKLDGVRCLAFWEGEEVKLMSRGGKYYECPHISKFLQEQLPRNLVLDGELYIHGETFQAITRLVKKLRPETVNVQLHVYDMVLLDDREASWPERRDDLKVLLATMQPHRTHPRLSSVVTETAHNEDEVREYYGKFMEAGYEGAIVRCYDNSEYRFGYRSKRLLKLKEFDDDEFEVVGFTDGVGKFKGHCLWQCETKDGGLFTATPKASMEDRRQMFLDGEKHIGDMLKVVFQGYTEEGLPRFPVSVGFRLEEDMDTAAKKRKTLIKHLNDVK